MVVTLLFQFLFSAFLLILMTTCFLSYQSNVLHSSAMVVALSFYLPLICAFLNFICFKVLLLGIFKFKVVDLVGFVLLS